MCLLRQEMAREARRYYGSAERGYQERNCKHLRKTHGMVLSMMRKTYMRDDGILLGEPDEDHADIARRILPLHGKPMDDYGGLYTHMFALGYARVAEDVREYHVEHTKPLSEAQRAAVEDVALRGKAVFVNNKRFVESKHVRGASGHHS